MPPAAVQEVAELRPKKYRGAESREAGNHDASVAEKTVGTQNHFLQLLARDGTSPSVQTLHLEAMSSANSDLVVKEEPANETSVVDHLRSFGNQVWDWVAGDSEEESSARNSTANSAPVAAPAASPVASPASPASPAASPSASPAAPSAASPAPAPRA